MGKKGENRNWGVLGILAIAIGIGLGAVLTEPLANFFKSTGFSMWGLLISIIGLAALFFGVDAYLAQRRGKPTQRILESRAKLK